jgi:hypothetical protein
MPTVRIDGDRVVIGIDLAMRLPVTAPRYMVEGRLFMDCSTADLAAGTVKYWHLRGLELTNAKSVPSGMPGGPPAPGKPPGR